MKIYRFILLFLIQSVILISQPICDEFEIVHLDVEPDSPWGNLLYFDVEIPDTSIYAPYFFLRTDDEFIQITDSISSYFWITGPTNVELLYQFDYEMIPENHLFSGNIIMLSGDNFFRCNMDFEFLVNTNIILGDMNEDEIINISDVVIIINLILNDGFNHQADLNSDSQINVLDILLILNIILEN